MPTDVPAYTLAAGDITLAARTYGLSAHLIRAIIKVESDGRSCSVRFEPGYRWLWDCERKRPWDGEVGQLTSLTAPDGFVGIGGQSDDTEWIGQRCSWGAMQLMGAVAREFGFLRAFPQLCVPYEGIARGCEYLLALEHRYRQAYGWTGVVAAYNAGSPRKTDEGEWVNQAYVEQVRAFGGFDEVES